MQDRLYSLSRMYTVSSVPRNIICADTPESPTTLNPPKTGLGSMPELDEAAVDVEFVVA